MLPLTCASTGSPQAPPSPKPHNMKTPTTCAIAVAISCRSVHAFAGCSAAFRSSLRPTSQQSFCPSSSTSTLGGPSTRRPRTGGSGGHDRNTAGLRGRSAAGRLNMFDATDLFQLQQWAGDISATEVKDSQSSRCFSLSYFFVDTYLVIIERTPLTTSYQKETCGLATVRRTQPTI